MRYTGQAVRRLWDTKVKEGALFGFACAALLGAALVVSKTNVSWDVFTKWALLTTYTVVVFGNFVSRGQAMWRMPAFWLFVVLGVVVHSVVFVAIGKYFPYWIVVWVVLVIGELLGMVYARDQMFVKRPSVR